jgi:hypothetical protein
MKSNEAPGVDTVPMEMWREFSTRSEGVRYFEETIQLNKEQERISRTM